MPDPTPARGCGPVRTVQSESADHVPPGTLVRYPTDPPVAGKHATSAAATGVHASPLPDLNVVHNLEHGHMVIHYRPGSVDEAVLEELATFVRSDVGYRLLVPRFSMPFDVALTAWEKLQGCRAPGRKIVQLAEDFSRLHARRAPEDVPGGPFP